MKRKITVAVTGVAMAVILAGCGSTRQIDVEETGSTKVPGTSWNQFCDGPNAVVWIKGRSGEPDELEAYVYEHWQCAPQFYAENPEYLAPAPAPADADGIIEDEED